MLLLWTALRSFRPRGSGYRGLLTVVAVGLVATFLNPPTLFGASSSSTVAAASIQAATSITATPTVTSTRTATATRTTTPTATPPPGGVYNFYTDALAAGWVPSGWASTVNLASTSYVHSGTVAVSYTITGAYGAFAPQLSSGSFDTTPFTNIRFWVNGEASGGQQLALTVKYAGTNTWGKVIKINPYITGGTVAAGQWNLVDMPLSVVGASNTTINRIALQGWLATAQPSVSVDDIDFYSVLPTSVTPSSTATSTSTMTPTATFTPTTAPTATPTDTPTAASSSTPTPTPTDTPTAVSSSTSTPTPTDTPAAAPSNTPTATPTDTPTNSATVTVTPTATITPAVTATATGTPTSSGTATSSATPLPGGVYNIYADTLAAGWETSWWGSTFDTASTTYVHSGTFAVSYTITKPYGAFAPLATSGTFDTTPYTNLRFWVNGETAGGQQLAVKVRFAGSNAWGNLIRINSYIAGGNVEAGQWKLVDIPLSVLGASNTTINRIGFQGWLATAQPSVSLDDIDLYAAASTTAIPTATVTPTSALTPTNTPTVSGPTTTVTNTPVVSGPTATPTDTPTTLPTSSATSTATLTSTRTSTATRTAIPTATPAPGGVYNVYTDALVNGWQSASWGATVNTASTAYVHSGTSAVSYTIYKAYGAFSPFVSPGPFDTTPFTNLRFWVNGEAAGGQQLSVSVRFASTNTWWSFININPYITGGSVVAGQWRPVDIPLSVLGASNTTINRLAFQGSLATAQPPVSIDDIDFYAAAPAIPTPTNTPTGSWSSTPTASPTNTPTVQPTDTPTVQPSNTTTVAPTDTPTVQPTDTPTATSTQVVSPTTTPTP